MNKLDGGFRILAWMVFGAILISCIQFLYFSLQWPLEICLDAAYYRFMGLSMAHGQWPYRDFENISPPLIHYINYLGVLTFGEGSLAFRLQDAFLVFSIAVLSAAYLLRFSQLTAFVGFASSFILPVIATPLGAFQREQIMAPFFLVSLILIEHAIRFPHRERGAFFLAIFLAGCTAFIKPTGALFALLLGLYFLWRTRLDLQPLWRRILTFGMLGAAAWIACAILLAAPLLLHGALDDFLLRWWPALNAWRDATEYDSPLAVLSRLFALAPRYVFLPHNGGVANAIDIGKVTLFQLLSLATFVALRRQRAASADGLLVLLLFSFVHYALQGKGYSYHAFPIWHSFAMITAVVLGDLVASLNRLHGPLRAAALTLFLFFCLGSAWIYKSARRVYRDTGLASAQGAQVFRSRLDQRIASLLRLHPHISRVQPLEQRYIVLTAMMKYSLKLASRFPMDHPFFSTGRNFDRYRAELMQQLEAQPPQLIVVEEGTSLAQTAIRPRRSKFPALDRMLKEQYELTEQYQEINGVYYSIYLLRDL
ncbi:MAG: hypothetical protein K1X75_07345 [Leptospirales bacterium]|nr:hypothetical protein [Leptospirales bacterium]